MPALEQLFEKEEDTGIPIPEAPREANEAEMVMQQVMQEIDKKPGKKLSEMI